MKNLLGIGTLSGFALLKGMERKRLELAEIKKACEGEGILSEYSSLCLKLFLIDTVFKRKIQMLIFLFWCRFYLCIFNFFS